MKTSNKSFNIILTEGKMKTSNESFNIILNVHLYIYRAKEKAKQNAMYQY